MAEDPRSDRRVALVTGGAAGIGRAVVERFAGDGWAVLFADRDAPAGIAVAGAVFEDGGVCRFEHLDLTDRERRGRLVSVAVETFGRLDVLVNNAATVGRRRAVLDLAEDDWDEVLETNLTATAFLARDAARHMAEAGEGAIVNVATIQERMPVATHVPYVSSKGGISALTRALAVELGPLGIRVNAVVPGVIMTPGMDEERDRAGLGTAAVSWPTLLPRPGHPRDVAAAVAYLASADAGFVTGSTITVDGGRSLSRRPDAFAAGMDTQPTEEESQWPASH